jgi:VWFA-related protein
MRLTPSCRRSGLAAALVFALAVPTDGAAARQAASPGVVQERASVVVVEIPVNVLGKDGRPLAGLEAKDFELYDDGRKQPIQAVEVIDLTKPPTLAGADAGPAEVPASARRLWLIVFDTSFTSTAGLLRAREGARDFVTASMPASDLAAVGTLSVDTGWKLLVNFTRDRTQLSAAIDTLGLPGLAVRSADPLGFAFTAPGTTCASASGLAGGAVGKNDAGFLESLRDVQNLQRQSNDEQARGRVTKLMTQRRAGLESSPRACACPRCRVDPRPCCRLSSRSRQGAGS